MFKRSLKNTLLLNIGAFLLVALLELLSIWTVKERFDSDYAFYSHALSYTVIIMSIIWVNHFLLIPYVLDKGHYLFYGIALLGSIFLGSYLRGYEGGWPMISKFFFFLIYTTGTGMAAFLLRRNIMFRRESDEQEKLQREMELNYLKEQVNPHFLFNSLNSIYSLSRQQSPETSTVVMQLSELMRYQLESTKKDAVRVKEELEFIENYVLLEEKRLGKRCTIELVIDGDMARYTIAPMQLIPFVENAIKHGAQSTNEVSFIDISATLTGTKLRFHVVNSKPVKAKATKGVGMGLANVKRRLQLRYPHAHDLSVDDNAKTFDVKLEIDLKGLEE